MKRFEYREAFERMAEDLQQQVELNEQLRKERDKLVLERLNVEKMQFEEQRTKFKEQLQQNRDKLGQ